MYLIIVLNEVNKRERLDSRTISIRIADKFKETIYKNIRVGLEINFWIWL